MTDTINETREAAALRAQVRSWIEESWIPDLAEREWLERLVDSGFGYPTWPTDRFGRGFSNELAAIVNEELSRAATTPAQRIGHSGLTIRDFCDDEQAQRLLRPLLTGEHRWCQLFSEPGAGSDLAGLQTRADRHGDEWIVNGQKVWTSGAVNADYAILLARTDWEVPKHQGITFFLIPMKQPGVEVRPIKQMHGGSTFNEVFMTEARVPNENVLGEVNAGWSIAMRTLMHERNRGDTQRGGGGTVEARPMQQAVDFRALARQTGRNTDPVVRQEIAYLYSLRQIASWTNMRASAARKAGRPPGPEVSIGKLAGTRISRVSANLNALILQAGAMVVDESSRPVVQALLSYHSASIAAGTDDVQRNIMGERVLGLPKDPQVDADVPFSQVRKAVAVKRFSAKD